MKHKGTQRIETARLILRRFRETDAEDMFRNWASDDEVTKFLTWPPHRSVEETKGLLADWVAAYEQPDKYEWCIELKEIGEAIGSIGGMNINEVVNSLEIGYCISKKYWHQGIVAEALTALVDFFFNEMEVNRINLRHDVNNPNSGKVMLKCGFKYEGTSRQWDHNNQGICDVAFYGLLREDFKEN